MNDEAAHAVLLVGPVGAGKTSVAVALGELLAARRLPVAVLDLDWLGWFHGPPGAPGPDELIAANLRAVWPRFRSAGARYLVLARALTSAAHVARIKEALSGVDTKIVLVTAPPHTIAARLARRDSGAILREHLAESGAMAAALAEARIHDFAIDNDSGSAAETARELAARLGWS